MKHLLTWLLACSLAATTLQAAVPILDPRITGTNSQVASGTFTVKSGATLATEAGALFSFSQPLSLGAGGLGVSLTDPNADRLTFWDDSAGSIAWLGLGTGLSISGTTLSVDSTLFAPSTATYIVQTANGTLTNEQALGALATGLLKNTTTTGVLSIAAAGTDFVGPGAVTTSGLTMATARLLGRSTASSGAIEEITVGSGLTLSSGTLSASGGGDVVGPASATDNALVRFDSTTGKLVQNSNVTLDDTGLLGLPAGVRQTFAPNATNAGLNVGSVAGDPSAPSNGDLWYDSTANELTARINGSNVALGAGGGGGSVASDTVWNAKGDLAVATADNTATRLAVGTNGHVLTADSAEATGLKWAAPAGGGTKTLARFSALDNQPPASSYATFGVRNSIALLAFDAGSDEHAVFLGVIPEGADFTTGIAVRLIWIGATATSGDVVWATAFERGNTDLDSDSWASAVSGTLTTSGTSGVPATITINHSGSEIDGLVAGELFRLRVTRDADAGGDTMSGDAQLLAVELRQR